MNDRLTHESEGYKVISIYIDVENLNWVQDKVRTESFESISQAIRYYLKIVRCMQTRL